MRRSCAKLRRDGRMFRHLRFQSSSYSIIRNKPFLPTQKNPYIAFLLSLVVPGLGQGYNAERSKGLTIFISCLLLGGIAAWLSGVNRLTIVLAVVMLWFSSAIDAYKTATSFGQPLDWYYRPSYVIAMLLLVGPLALPLLWRSTYFSRTARWVWTVIVVSVVFLFLATPYLLHLLIQQMPELETTLRNAGVEL